MLETEESKHLMTFTEITYLLIDGIVVSASPPLVLELETVCKYCLMVLGKVNEI